MKTYQCFKVPAALVLALLLMPGRIALAADGNASAKEGSDVTFTIDKPDSPAFDKPVDTALRYKYTTSDDSATAGKDYTSASGTVVWAVGVKEKTISVKTLTDEIEEEDETFTLTLSDPEILADDYVGGGTYWTSTVVWAPSVITLTGIILEVEE